MVLTLKQRIQKHFWIKAFTPKGDEIKREEKIEEGSKKVEVYVLSTKEKVFEALYAKKKGFLGLSRWSLVYDWSGPNDMRYRSFNNRI